MDGVSGIALVCLSPVFLITSIAIKLEELLKDNVQPGLTCYWQIGGRANVKWDEWVELDLDYIADMGLWTDLKMIVKTIPAVFDSEGAY